MDAFFRKKHKKTCLSELRADKVILQTENISETENMASAKKTMKKLYIHVHSSILQISPEDWDACAMDSTGNENFNPFVMHDFLSSLELTGCVAQETGWLPQHVVAADQDGRVLGVVPLYLKSHSYGEYVFDHSWADAYHRYGSPYYPKMQCCVPFTPVTGHRILVRNTKYRDQIFEKLLNAIKEYVNKLRISSFHATFLSESECEKLRHFGFLQRIGMQYHWKNRGYKSFDDFLMDLRQSKRAAIRKERKKIKAQNLRMRRLRGYEIKTKHWDSFYSFYHNTVEKRWGHAYLTREFFYMIASKMGDHVLLVVAEDEEELVAGALNFIGNTTLFGRHWGCHAEAFYPNLHFETCFYQAIEAAIEWNLNTVEAGAQGEHKIQRGYMPVTTYSCHYLPNRTFNRAVGEFLRKETSQVNLVMDLLRSSGPFKDGII
eukprot:TRINITY_DN2468_c0_g1_i3.p1 TRINITY_DN2468_c0_g1~~TRINITY_DN2468_c0_g1_i3.p1  ORF type:complete len:433 (+),score=76.89 TRINITY_DN2468_c0_g1_i3:280-1578(+)